MANSQPSTSSGIKRKTEEKSTWSEDVNQPADKRSKHEDENQNEWDEDDWEYSQADMRELDLLSSQAIAETSRQTEETVFVAPKSSLSLKKTVSSSSSSLSNGSESTYPSTNESYRRSSTSITSSSSSDNQTSSYRLHSHPSFGTGTSESSVPVQPGLEMRDSWKKEMNRWKTDFKSISEEKKAIEKELFSKDGEIKNLRVKLQRRDTELNSLRTENLVKTAEQKQHQSDKENNLKVMNEKLETRLQFKENDFSELEEKCRFLEHKLQLLSTSSPKKLTSSPAKSRSPLVLKAVSPRPVKGMFPTGETFRADERPEISTSRPSTSVTIHKENVKDTGVAIRTRRCILNTAFSSGEVNGPKLVAKLLHHNFNDEGEVTDRGVVGLLHTPSVSSHIRSLQFDRDQNNLLLSPVKNRKLSGNLKEEPSEIKPIVDKEHYNLAIHGLQTLLNSVESCDDIDICPGLTTAGAVLILPLLTDYFLHYVSMLSSSTETNTATSPTNSGSLKSSSCESSIESLTSSLGLLLKDGAMYAQNMEILTLSSLVTLKHLVTCCPAVREVLYPKFDLIPDVERGTSKVNKPTSEAESSDMETDQMTASLFTAVPISSSAIHVHHQQVQSSNLLNIIVQLATPSLENPVFDVGIVKQALEVLNSLVRKTEINQLDSLINLTCVLNNCLQCETYPVLIISAIDLLSKLCLSEKIRTSLTAPTVSCSLAAIYMLANKTLENASREEMRQIHHKILVCMFNVSCYRNGVNQLIETSCACGHDFPRSMVLVVYNVLEDYLQCKDDLLLGVLRQGLHLLHTIYLYDNNFGSICRCFDIPHHYVNLLWSLYSIFKLSPEQYENELNMLSDIGQFIDEDDESEEEDAEG